MSELKKNSKPLNEVIDLIIENFWMQVNGYDVAYPYLQGSPGGGKTASLFALKEKFNCGFISTHFALKPIEETGGIPQFEKVVINGNTMTATSWSFPDIIKELYLLSEKYSNENQFVVWLLDDMHLCGATHMALLYELLTERKLRDYKIPKNVAIVLAGNTSNKAGAKTMYSAIINRVFICPVHSEFSEWKKNFGMKAGIHPAVMSFLSNEQYLQFFHEEEQVDTSWGSPRSWTRLSNMIKIKEEFNSNKEINSEDILYIAEGHVGRTAASEFMTYYKIYSKFNIQEILENSKNFVLPEEMVDRYALAYSITNHYIGNENRKNLLKNYSEIICKYGQESPELTILMMKEIITTEKILGKKNLYSLIAIEIEKQDPDLINKIIEEIIEL